MDHFGFGNSVLKQIAAFAASRHIAPMKTPSPASLNASQLRCDTCGSGLARESGVSGDINVDYAAVFASKPAPTWIALN